MTESQMRRYCGLSSAIELLQTKKLTFRDPKNWDDRNDTDLLDFYKKEKGFKTLQALCFAECIETSHHWKVYAAGMEGVCIRFNKTKLTNALDRCDHIRHGPMNYPPINKVQNTLNEIDQLPFTKRFPYNGEEEYRVLYTNRKCLRSLQNVPLQISCIERITLSPWLPKAMHNPIKQALRSINGCEELNVTRSTLTSNDRFLKAAKGKFN